MISAAGGLIGTILGISVVAIGGMLFGITTVVKPQVIVIAVAFSAMVEMCIRDRFMIIPVGILLLEHSVEGLNVLSTIQSLITISSLPVLVALVVLFWSFGKVLRKDISDGTRCV